MKYEVGDLVKMKSAGTGNGLPYNKKYVEVELLEIDHKKNPTGLSIREGSFMVCYNGKYFISHTNLIISLVKKKEPQYEIF